MRVLIDTNVLISATLKNTTVPFAAYCRAVTAPNQGLICEQNIEELKRVYNRKFPGRRPILDRFLAAALGVLEIVPIPEEESDAEKDVRDV